MAGITTATDLETCGINKRPISLVSASDEERAIANNLYYFSALPTKGRAQLILRTIEVGNG